MPAFAVTIWMVRAVQRIPAPLRRALDAWSRQRAASRRRRRLQLAARRASR